MSKNKKCVCTGSNILIFSCSGGADVAELADQAARKMTKKGIGKMYCLAGIGGEVKGILETTKAAEKLFVIDGCPVACAKKILEKYGFNDYKYIELTSMGFEKGNSPLTNDSIDKIVEKSESLL